MYGKVIQFITMLLFKLESQAFCPIYSISLGLTLPGIDLHVRILELQLVKLSQVKYLI